MVVKGLPVSFFTSPMSPVIVASPMTRPVMGAHVEEPMPNTLSVAMLCPLFYDGATSSPPVVFLRLDLEVGQIPRKGQRSGSYCHCRCSIKRQCLNVCCVARSEGKVAGKRLRRCLTNACILDACSRVASQFLQRPALTVQRC